MVAGDAVEIMSGRPASHPLATGRADERPARSAPPDDAKPRGSVPGPIVGSGCRQDMKRRDCPGGPRTGPPRSGKWHDAEVLLHRLPSGPDGPVDRADSRILYAMSVTARLAGRPAEALRLGRLALQRTPVERSAETARMRVLTAVGLASLDLGQQDEGAAALAQALRLSRQAQRADGPDRTDILVGLARRDALGRQVEAERCR